MAIYTGGMRMRGEAIAAANRIAAQQKKAQDAENKRRGRSKLFGKIGGFLAGEAGMMLLNAALTAATGGLAGPALAAAMAAGKVSKYAKIASAMQKGGRAAKLAQAVIRGGAMTLGKAGAHQATTGKSFLGKRLKTPGQVDKIEAGGKYGYGRGDAATLSQALEEGRKSEVDLGTLAGDIGGSFAAQIAFDKAGGLFEKGGKDFVDTGVPFQETELGGFGVEPEGGSFMDWLQSPNTEYDFFSGQDKDTSQLFSPKEDAPFDLEGYMEEGGQVPQLDQNALLELAILSAMENQGKAYDDTPLEEENQEQTIAGYFASQGKTLGGNNTQSLSQILGR